MDEQAETKLFSSGLRCMFAYFEQITD
uniref:Uncharacterized protein n=1 Tax=Arundo donax TaxID=35708 RepID=A0A0A9AE16_ARUDO